MRHELALLGGPFAGRMLRLQEEVRTLGVPLVSAETFISEQFAGARGGDQPMEMDKARILPGIAVDAEVRRQPGLPFPDFGDPWIRGPGRLQRTQGRDQTAVPWPPGPATVVGLANPSDRSSQRTTAAAPSNSSLK